MSDDISVYENLSDTSISFDSKDEFLEYYQNHKSEIDRMKTRGLNLKYNINGFKLGRKGGKIVLYPTRSPQARNEAYERDEEDDYSSSSEEEEPVKPNKKQQVKNQPVKKSAPVRNTKVPAQKQGNSLSVDDKLNNLNGRLKKVESVLSEVLNHLGI